MVKCCVFFAVRTEFLNIIQTSLGFKGLIEYPSRVCGREIRASENKTKDTALLTVRAFVYWMDIGSLIGIKLLKC
jgi:hypothetical protein